MPFLLPAAPTLVGGSAFVGSAGSMGGAFLATPAVTFGGAAGGISSGALATTGGVAMTGGGGLGLWSGLALAGMGVTTGLMAYGQYQQGKYMEGMAKYDAALAMQEVEQTEIAGEYETRAERKESRRTRARMLLQFAKGGALPTTGTPLLVQAEEAALAEKDVRLMGYGYRLKGRRAYSQAQIYRMQGGQASRAARFGMGTTIATGAYRTGMLLGA